MNTLKVSIIQSRIQWENKPANLDNFAHKIRSIGKGSDLIILPEMFTTGFSMNARGLAEPMEGKTIKWLKEQAASQNAVITGSFIATENGSFFNRLVWMQPDGQYLTYDKRHLFTLAKEEQTYTAGKVKQIFNYKGWSICPQICYDLRFPVWSRNVEDYDLLFYVANFPAKRRDAWKALLKARAIENQVYTIGVNMVDVDGNDIYYSGDSSVIDYNGEILYQVAHIEDCFTIKLSRQKQEHFRSKLQFLPDRDDFEIK